MTEIYKIVNGIAPPIMNYLFTFHLNQHNLRNFQELSPEKRNIVKYGLEKLHTGRLLFGQNYHQNINLQVRYLQVMQRIRTKSQIYLNNKNRSHSLYIHFTVCWNWNVTHIVLPSKKIHKRDNIGIILAGIYSQFLYNFRFMQYILYY